MNNFSVSIGSNKFLNKSVILTASQDIYYQLQLGLCPVAVLHKQYVNSNTECVTLIQSVKTLLLKEVSNT
jgi:hypothetical protein